ncbi:MAG TPA: AMIN domain-containing protein [Clostridia bacterium]|nr:AMIN domain-containing protein [Clostridia bacterium]
MKKIISFLLVVIMSVFSINLAYADTLNAKSSSLVNTLKEVKCLPGKNQDKVIIPLGNYKGYKFMRLNNPDRIVVDIPNAAAPLTQVKINANGKYVKTIRYAANGTSNARIVLDVTGSPQYFIEEAKKELVIYVVSQVAKNMYYYMDSTGATLVLKGVKSYSSSSYKGTLDLTGKKYTLTFPSNLTDIAGSKISINDAYLNYISVKKDARTKKTSLIFYAKEKFTYNCIPKKEAGGFAIKLTKTSASGRGDDVRDDDVPFNVAHSFEGSCDKVSFGLIDYAGYTIERLTDPDRIVIDIPNSMRPIADNQISVNSSRIKSVQYSQYDEDTIRAVVNLNGQYQYHTLENSGELALYIEDPTYKNINYSNNGGSCQYQLEWYQPVCPKRFDEAVYSNP